MPRATNLNDAYDVLDPQPIDFTTQADFYVEPPPREHDDGERAPNPMTRIRKALQTTSAAKMFLAGHVGAGKSTQLRRLAADPSIEQRFSVVMVRLDMTDLPFLDPLQLLFHMAIGLYEHGKRLGLFKDDKPWRKHLERLDAALYGGTGLSATEGTVGLEIDLFLVKVREELRVSENRRREFRTFGETNRTVLIDLLRELSVEIETALLPKTLLVIIDDLDKVRDAERQDDLFHKGVGTLFAPRFRVIYTLPVAVAFDPSRRELINAVEHLYPERVLEKSPDGFDPLHAFRDDALPFFRDAVHKRVEPDLVEEEAIRLATAFSGGVVRYVFFLLKEASAIAEMRGATKIDAKAVRSAVREERLRLTRGLTREDYDALLAAHQTHDRKDDARYQWLQDIGVLLECYNDDAWYEAHPILWDSLKRRAHDAAG
ncbi:MAG: hypothetical protein U0441_06545 [Polyangiaceae bacterium]